MRVGKETRRWQQGCAIVFDDLYEHEVWNRTGENRIVLIVDLWHPELTPREIAVIEGMPRYAFTTLGIAALTGQATSAQGLHAVNSRDGAGSPRQRVTL